MSSERGNLDVMDVVDPYAPKVPTEDELPYSDGEPMESDRHVTQMMVLIETLREHVAERGDTFVGGNMFVYFSDLQLRGDKFRGPDVFVVLDTDGRKPRKSWIAYHEGGRLPNVVIELLSASTERVDRGEKKRVYERIWRTGHYFLFDPETRVLEGFVLVNERYAPIAPDARGDLPITSMGLALGVRPGPVTGVDGEWLRWIDPSGAPLETGFERADRFERERDQAQRELDEAVKRIAELEAKLRERR